MRFGENPELISPFPKFNLFIYLGICRPYMWYHKELAFAFLDESIYSPVRQQETARPGHTLQLFA